MRAFVSISRAALRIARTTTESDAIKVLKMTACSRHQGRSGATTHEPDSTGSSDVKAFERGLIRIHRSVALLPRDADRQSGSDKIVDRGGDLSAVFARVAKRVDGLPLRDDEQREQPLGCEREVRILEDVVRNHEFGWISAYSPEPARSYPVRRCTHACDPTLPRPRLPTRRLSPTPSSARCALPRRTRCRPRAKSTARSLRSADSVWPEAHPRLAGARPRIDGLGSRSNSSSRDVSVWRGASFINLARCFSVAYLSYSSARRLLDPTPVPFPGQQRAYGARVTQQHPAGHAVPAHLGKLAARSRHVPAPLAVASERCGAL